MNLYSVVDVEVDTIERELFADSRLSGRMLSGRYPPPAASCLKLILEDCKLNLANPVCNPRDSIQGSAGCKVVSRKFEIEFHEIKQGPEEFKIKVRENQYAIRESAVALRRIQHAI
jgi:hypothetical protein